MTTTREDIAEFNYLRNRILETAPLLHGSSPRTIHHGYAVIISREPSSSFKDYNNNHQQRFRAALVAHCGPMRATHAVVLRKSEVRDRVRDALREVLERMERDVAGVLGRAREGEVLASGFRREVIKGKDYKEGERTGREIADGKQDEEEEEEDETPKARKATSVRFQDVEDAKQKQERRNNRELDSASRKDDYRYHLTTTTTSRHHRPLSLQTFQKPLPPSPCCSPQQQQQQQPQPLPPPPTSSVLLSHHHHHHQSLPTRLTHLHSYRNHPSAKVPALQQTPQPPLLLPPPPPPPPSTRRKPLPQAFRSGGAAVREEEEEEVGVDVRKTESGKLGLGSVSKRRSASREAAAEYLRGQGFMGVDEVVVAPLVWEKRVGG